MIYAELQGRGVITVSGADRTRFLQGLVTSDVMALQDGEVQYSCLLTPQGKFLHDFFIVARDNVFLLETEQDKTGALIKRFQTFRLRSKVAFEDISDGYSVFVIWDVGNGSINADVPALQDPRLPVLGLRCLVPAGQEARVRAALDKAGAQEADAKDYDIHRLRLGIPDGSRDMVPEFSTLLESNVDELGGISWTKGCYMGQELTARMKHRGLVKKRLLPVVFEGGVVPPPRTPVLAGEQPVGEVRSGMDGRALALLRLDRLKALESQPLTAASQKLTVQPPFWLKLEF